MRNLFIVFTAYHVKVSNYLSDNIFYAKKNENKIIILDNYNSPGEFLNYFVDNSLYAEVLNVDISEVSLKFLLKNFVINRNLVNSKIEKLLSIVEEFKPDNIIYFSDNPIAIQLILNENILSNKIFVEEGLAIYTTDYRISLKEKIKHIINKLIYKNKKFKLFPHGKSKYEDFIIAREPDLINGKVKSLQISKEMFKEIMFYNKPMKEKKYDIDNNILLCPAGTEFSKNKIKKIYREIFDFYVDDNRKLYVKLHPAEKYVIQIKEIISEYKKSVFLIEDENITSEDIIITYKPSIIISDYSSTMINAIYLFDNIEIVSYYGMMQQKYGIDIGFKSLLFNKLIEEGKIKEFKDYKIFV